MGMTVFESFGAIIIPSTLRLMKLRTCSNCLFASPSATPSSMVMPFLWHSSLMRSHAATQPSVCNVSNATPIVLTLPCSPALVETDPDVEPGSDFPQPARRRAVAAAKMWRNVNCVCILAVGEIDCSESKRFKDDFRAAGFVRRAAEFLGRSHRLADVRSIQFADA